MNRLYRSRDDRMLAGVAGGLADLWDADPSLIRIIWALLVVFTGGLALVVYIVMAIVVPEEDDLLPVADPGGDPAALPFAATAETGWTAPSATDVRRAARRAARAERRATRGSGAGGSGALIGGAVLILIGGFFLAREFLPTVDFDFFWPLVLVGVGVVLLVTSLRGGDRSDPG